MPHREVAGFGDSSVDRYDGEIAYVDAQIGKIVEALRATGALDDTIIAITSDHGEGFGEHGARFHGNSLYNELVRVPFVVIVPDGQAQRFDTPVSTLDIGATLLDLVGIDRPAGQNGVSLARSVLDGVPPSDRVVLAELVADSKNKRNLRAAFYRHRKLIWDLDANAFELYLLDRDPKERINAIGKDSKAMVEMRAHLAHASDRELSLLPSDRQATRTIP